tara:strand:+ start:368 stop:550 length:183 start_codon:yes stop_codon:yes gene_type:complete
MKQLFFTTMLLGLISCQQNKHEIQIMGMPQDATDLPFDLDSIQNVRQLLDSLEAIPPKNF